MLKDGTESINQLNKMDLRGQACLGTVWIAQQMKFMSGDGERSITQEATGEIRMMRTTQSLTT